VGEQSVDGAGERRGRSGLISPDQKRALCGMIELRPPEWCTGPGAH
jgi:hypothetical protein